MGTTSQDGDAVQRLLTDSVGPFMFDHEHATVTLQPGTYVLTQPITFGILPATNITGVLATERTHV